MQPTTRIAAYGLLLREEHILLCRLSQVVPGHAGRWTLPGGGIEFGEHPADAMIREVREETGLVVRPRGVAGVDSALLGTPERPFHAIRIVFHAEILGGALRDELDGSTDRCGWWPLAEAPALPLVELATVGLRLARG